METSKWAALAEGYRPAVPALSWLNTHRCPVTLAQGLAAVGYRFKNGQHTALSAPFQRPGDLTWVLHYLHRTRVEALSGRIRANWLNAPRMREASDLIVWTRAAFQYTRLRQEPGLSVRWGNLARQAGSLPVRQNSPPGPETIVCQQTSGLTRSCDTLSGTSRPFVMVVDLTPFGYRKNPGELLDHLTVYFPDCPVVILTSLDDRTMETKLPKPGIPVSIWHQHPDHPTPLITRAGNQWTVVLTELPDHRLENALLRASECCRRLHKLLGRQDDPVQTSVITPVRGILAGLKDLGIPLHYFETEFIRIRHGDRFPFESFRDRLESIRLADLPCAEVDAMRNRTVGILEQLMDQIETGHTGKSQALEYWLNETDAPGKDRLIVVQSEWEAGVLSSWLNQDHLPAVESGQLTVVGAKSAKERYRKLDKPFQEVLILGHPGKSEGWVVYLGERTHWLVYPQEKKWLQQHASEWVASRENHLQQKEQWWQLDDLSPWEMSRKNVEFQECTWNQCSGQYIAHKTVAPTPAVDPAGVGSLWSVLEWTSPGAVKKGPPAAGEVTIVTERGTYRYHRHQLVYSLDGISDRAVLDHRPAKNISPGVQLVQIRSENDEGLDLMDFLQEYARKPLPDQAAHCIQINRWLNHVDRAIQACGSLEALHQRLCNDGIQIEIEAVRQWIRYRGIFPKIDRAIVPLVAKISRPGHCEEEICAIIHSQKQLQNHHRRIGRAIRQLAMETKAPTPATSGRDTDAPMNEVLASLVSFEEVVSVHHHAKNGIAAVQPASLVELVEQMVATSRGRLAITSAGLRSAQSSPYRDFGKVRRCLEILREEYFQVYGPDKSLQLGAAIAAGRPYQIDFKGDTAATTKGKHATYQRRYRNKVVDIGKHLGIGDSGAPERCFRLHFHWDEASRKIVIHHAGRHLPSGSD